MRVPRPARAARTARWRRHRTGAQTPPAPPRRTPELSTRPAKRSRTGGSDSYVSPQRFPLRTPLLDVAPPRSTLVSGAESIIIEPTGSIVDPDTGVEVRPPRLGKTEATVRDQS